MSTHNRIIDVIQTKPTLQTAAFSKPLSVLAIKRSVCVWPLTTDQRHPPLPPPLISVKVASDAVNLQLRLLTTHICILVSYRWIRISWKWRTWSNTSIAKVLLYEIHWIHLDNFSIKTRLKTVNSGGKNLGFGDERSWKKPRFQRRFRLP